MKSYGSLRYKPDEFPYFPLMVLIHVTSAIIDAAVAVTLASSALYSVDVDAARFSIMMSLVFTMAPFVVLAPSISFIVAKVKVPRIVLAICLNLVRLCGLLLMALATSQTSSARLALFPLAFVMLVLSKCYSVTKTSVLPQITNPESYPYFSSRLAMATSIVSISVGSLLFAVAGIFSESVTLFIGFCIVAVSCSMSLGSYIKLSRRIHTRLINPKLGDRSHIDTDSRTSPVAELSLRNRTRAIRSLITYICSLRFIAGAVTIGIALHYRDTKQFLVVFFLFATCASSITNLFAARLNSYRFARYFMLILLGIFCIACAQLVVSNRFVTFLLVSSLLGVLSAYSRVVYDSRSAYVIPHEINAQLMARIEVLMQLAWVGGALFAVTSFSTTSVGTVATILCLLAMWAFSSHMAVSKKERERF